MWALIIDGAVRDTTDTDPANRYHADLRWVPLQSGFGAGDLYDGSTFSHPPAPPPGVPQSVSRMQARLALLAIDSPANAGKKLLDDVDDAVAANPDRRFKEAWGSATTIERHGLFVRELAPAIPGLNNDAALDALFIAAANIQT